MCYGIMTELESCFRCLDCMLITVQASILLRTSPHYACSMTVYPSVCSCILWSGSYITVKTNLSC